MKTESPTFIFGGSQETTPTPIVLKGSFTPFKNRSPIKGIDLTQTVESDNFKSALSNSSNKQARLAQTQINFCDTQLKDTLNSARIDLNSSMIPDVATQYNHNYKKPLTPNLNIRTGT